ncbi:MAG: hypothetical protein JWO11_64 [Nocardioides sp.]|nr:hypothetical protein [Nocardioides sp.]
MAKTAKTDRQAVIEEMRKKQKGAEKRRGFAIVGVCVVIALLIIGAAAYQPIKDAWDLRKFNNIAVSDIGAPASACQKVTTKPADGNQDHVAPGTPIAYTDAPPSFGQHYSSPDPMARKLYTAADRPELGTLVHNLEHGYTILWYDETAAADKAMMKDITAIASKFSGTDNMRTKFKAVPWLSTDEGGNTFPKGQHIALTHWSIGGAGASNTDNQVGVWQYCSAPSGDALKRFMINYPYMDSPEPTAM